MQIERERFQAWLESQPKDREFDYSDIKKCAICCFFHETTKFKTAKAGGKYVRLVTGEETIIPIPEWLHERILMVYPLTIINMLTRYYELFPQDKPEPDQPAQADTWLVPTKENE